MCVPKRRDKPRAQMVKAGSAGIINGCSVFAWRQVALWEASNIPNMCLIMKAFAHCVAGNPAEQPRMRPITR